MAGAALLLASAPLGAALADRVVYFMPPAAEVSITSYDDINNVRKGTAADFSLFSACGPDHVRYVTYGLGGGFGKAQAGRGVGHFAMAGASELTGVLSEASEWMFVRDPQNRSTVKLNVTINAYAVSQPPEASPVTGANYLFSVGTMKGTPSALVSEDGCTVKSANSVFDWIDSSFMILGYDRHQTDLYGNVTTTGGLNTYVNGVLMGQAPQSYLPTKQTFEVAPNQGGSVIVVRATAGGGLAAIDPVITAHPDNPDVEIDIRVPDEDTGRHPLDGFTAEDLTALGIDPQPFVDLGFLAASSESPPPPASGDTTPPVTAATTTPDPNALGWNSTSVIVTLGATDNASGSGIREVHYSLDGAATGSQVVPGASAAVTVSVEGTTTVSYFAIDNAGNAEAAKTLTLRIDKTPPSLAGLPASGCTLWPPDHRLVQVGSVSAADAQSGVAGFTLDASSNEPEVSTGDGDVGPDTIVTNGVVQLRAERAGNGPGRSYTITARAIDHAGNVATETATCTVPHDRGKH
jgi:hypothetical protein